MVIRREQLKGGRAASAVALHTGHHHQCKAYASQAADRTCQQARAEHSLGAPAAGTWTAAARPALAAASALLLHRSRTAIV